MSGPPTDARPAASRSLERLLTGVALGSTEAERLLEELVAPDTPPALQGALLAALRAQGETSAVLSGFARGLLGHARLVPRAPGRACLDTAGTGGDGRGSFNLSSAAALVLAALDVPVAKHGNRAVSSRCGSADLFEALGVGFPSTPQEAGARLEQDGFVFLFAPHFHPATAALAGVRRELGVRTIFNLLGPLVNPARPSHQLVGAASASVAALLAGALAELDVERAFVVHGSGFDEATPCEPFLVLDVAPGRGPSVLERRVAPESFGLERCRPEDLAGGDARENAERLERVLAGREKGPLRDAIALNAALGLLALEREHEPRRALARAQGALEDGRARSTLERLRSGARPAHGQDPARRP